MGRHHPEGADCSGYVQTALAGDRLVRLALGRGGYAMECLGDVDDNHVTTLDTRFVTARRYL